ncbi:MAG: hypothetical protein ACREXO_08515 [Advenella sp.]
MECLLNYATDRMTCVWYSQRRKQQANDFIYCELRLVISSANPALCVTTTFVLKVVGLPLWDACTIHAEIAPSCEKNIADETFICYGIVSFAGARVPAYSKRLTILMADHGTK